MASILDSGLTNIFSVIFVFLLVFTVVYGILKWRKWMGDQPGTYAMIAFTMAFLMALAEPARNFVTFIAPWYLALAMVGFFMLLIVSMFGLSAEKDFPKIVADGRVKNWIVILSIIILIAGLGLSLGPSLTPGSGGTTPGPQIGPEPGTPGSTNTGDFGTNVVNTIFHPKVLGLLVTFIIAALAVYFLSEGSK